jgi:hypothetical protein
VGPVKCTDDKEFYRSTGYDSIIPHPAWIS